ncbi:MAG TPA: DNA cytosine methyltransferase [Burkholderiaceae bacterium]|nr:DNA cytosine methyltransferase [Burkholderiaceae bacterium]
MLSTLHEDAPKPGQAPIAQIAGSAPSRTCSADSGEGEGDFERGEMNELALFAGAGGGILGGYLLGWRTVCAVEYNAYARSVLLARQNDGTLPPFPIWDDVRTFDGGPWRGLVDVVSGGFPCQDISAQGKRAGIEGKNSGLWRHMARIIGEVRPRFAFIENSPELIVSGLDRVLADLAAMGFDAEWGDIPAAALGAPHLRNRVWVVAHAQSEQRVHEPDCWKGAERLSYHANPWEACSWDEATPRVCRVDDGLPHRVDRTERLGNGQVPRVAATAFTILAEPE